MRIHPFCRHGGRPSKASKHGHSSALAVLVGLVTAAAPAAESETTGEAAPLPPLAVYAKRDTLPATLLATRAALAAWRADQEAARPAVTWGPWSVTEAMKPEIPGPTDDPAAKGADGKPLWQPRPGWKDRQFLPMLPAGQPHPAAAVWLTRTAIATKPAVVTIGLGGGDRNEVRLNGRAIHTPDTRVCHERYGCSLATDAILPDQVMVDVALPAGTNRLTLGVSQQEVGRQIPFRLWFSAAPDPVPHLWQRIRRDFPPQGHALLEAVPYTWFESGGWLDASDARLERGFIADVAASNAPLAGLLGPRLAALESSSVPAADPRWLDLCATAAEQARALDRLQRLAAAVAELDRSDPSYRSHGFAARLAELRAAILRGEPSRPAVDNLARRALVRENPLLKGRKLLFARRYTYDSRHYYDDYYAGLREWGGNLCELDPASGKVREIVPKLAGGIFDRFDISGDGRRVVFGYRAPRPGGFRIWECGVDGSGLRQLTVPPADEPARIARHAGYRPEAMEKDPRLYGHWTDDMHPCYLPDGRIVFVSSRSERTVLCGGHSLTCTTLYRMNADGTGLHELSQGALTESTPTLLDDGRILYTRWEYVYKGIAAVQSLWAMRPDGTASEEIYGHNIDNPGIFFAGRQVPGAPDRIVAVGCGHEPLAVGSIRAIDRTKDRRTKEAMTSLTPEVETRNLRGFFQFRNGRWNAEDVHGPFFTDPYPLSEHFVLVSHNPASRYNDRDAYGIWLIDTFGNRVPVYDDPEMSCFQPMLLEARPPAPRLPAMIADDGETNGEATVLLVDLHRSFTNVAPGAVKYLRVMEQIPRSWAASQVQPGDGVRGQATAVSLNTHIWIGVLLGTVPVEADGSAFFRVPARRNLYVTALDEDFMEVQKMRTFVNLQPGETRSCVGCHDPRDGTPVTTRPLAMNRAPSAIAPQPGDAGPRPIHYPSDVQPVLDRHCVACHGGEKPKGGLDLSGELTTHFNRSYENLLKKGLVNFIQEWTGPEPELAGPGHVSNGSMLFSEAVPPYTFGSHKSRLIGVLRKGHHDVKLPREEFIRLATWVDANAPYYGSYFGRKHISAKGRPGFRPVPTIESARGIEPPPYVPPALPAKLLASWAADALPAKFDGTTFVAGAAPGVHEAVSVALWVRPESLGNRWNPLLFTDGANASAFHLSLLDDGTPNVAINYGGKMWMHNRADTALAPGAWRHVAVVCDPRAGGSIRFFVDGKPAGRKPLDLGIPIDLAAFRLGAWSQWAKQPANNFHGELAGVRLFGGLLTDEEIAALAQLESEGVAPICSTFIPTSRTPFGLRGWRAGLHVVAVLPNVVLVLAARVHRRRA
jgi:hypothetical protein